MNTAEEPSNELVSSLGSIILGSVVLTAVYFISPVPVIELVQWAGLVLLPVLAIAFGLGLISMGTVKMIWNTKLTEKVDEYIKEERKRRRRHTANGAQPKTI